MLTTIHGAHWLVLDFPFPCEIHFRTLNGTSEGPCYRVLVAHFEPYEFCITKEDLETYHSYFDLIVSCHPGHMSFPNAVFEIYGGLFVKNLPKSKEFSASFLYSQGRTRIRLDGYTERTEFVQKFDRVTIPMRVHRSGLIRSGEFEHLPLLNGDSKDQLFESMFHVAIENTRQVNYFTEKIFDCFATYTVPIYWGCPNIGEFFNMDGIIVADSYEHAITLLNELTPADYWRRLDAMRDNFRRSRPYWDWLSRLRSLILREHAKTTRPLIHTESLSA